MDGFVIKFYLNSCQGHKLMVLQILFIKWFNLHYGFHYYYDDSGIDVSYIFLYFTLYFKCHIKPYFQPSTGTDDTIDKVKNCSSEQEKSHVEDNDEQGDGDTAKAETIAEQNKIYDQIKEILIKLIHDGKSIKEILTSGGDTSNNHQVMAHTDNMMAYFEDVSPLIEQIQEVNVYDRTDSLFEVIYLTTEDITLKSNALARLQNWNGQNCTSLLSQIEKASDVVIINTGAKIARLLVPVDY